MRVWRSLLCAAVLVAAPMSVLAQSTIDLSMLGLGPIAAIRPVELDGRPGSEYLVRTSPDFSPAWPAPPCRSHGCTDPADRAGEWHTIYPRGCLDAGVIVLREADQIVDHNGDGIQDVLRFDATTQRATLIPFPACAPPQ